MAHPAFDILLLASGLSRRFGAGDKLLAEIDGEPILAATARTLAGLVPREAEVGRRLAVVDAIDGARGLCLAAHGFAVVANPAPERGQGASLACGASALSGGRAVLVALADMPFVTAGHLGRLVAAHVWDDDRAATISRIDGRHLPPVLFGPGHLDALRRLDGDDGGRAVLKAATRVAEVEAPPAELRDIDTPDDLAVARSGPVSARHPAD